MYVQTIINLICYLKDCRLERIDTGRYEAPCLIFTSRRDAGEMKQDKNMHLVGSIEGSIQDLVILFLNFNTEVLNIITNVHTLYFFLFVISFDLSFKYIFALFSLREVKICQIINAWNYIM